MIQISNLSKIIGGCKKLEINDISINAGEIIAIVGPADSWQFC